MAKTVKIKLDSEDQVVAADWAATRLDGYLENLQDDQHLCYACGHDRHQHIRSGEFDSQLCINEHQEVIGDHEYLWEFPKFTMKVTPAQMEIAVEPAMVLSFVLNNIFYPNGDFDQAGDDDFYDYGDVKPSEFDLSRTLWLKIHKALEQQE